MEIEKILKWVFEAPDDVVTPEEFKAWEKTQQIELSKEHSRELYDRIMEKVKK